MSDAQQEKLYNIPDDASPYEQIEVLAEFIVDRFPGEPSQSEGAVATAIRLLKQEHKATWFDGWEYGHKAGVSDTIYRLKKLDG